MNIRRPKPPLEFVPAPPPKVNKGKAVFYMLFGGFCMLIDNSVTLVFFIGLYIFAYGLRLKLS
jgi:hypothetical protein